MAGRRRGRRAGRHRVDGSSGADGFRRFIRHDPVGVVLVVAPWNYPYLCSVNAVVPALLAGNAVVLKAASQTPLVAERWAEGLAAAGLPGGVFQYVHTDHDGVARHGGRRPGRLRRVHGLGGRRPRRPAGGLGPVRRHGPRARRQGPGLRAGRRPARGDGGRAGRRRVLQRRPVVLRASSASTSTAPVTTSSSTRSSEAAVGYVLGDPLDPGHHARPAGAGGRGDVRARPGRRGGRRRRPGAGRPRRVPRRRGRHRRTWRRRCWSASTTACGS